MRKFIFILLFCFIFFSPGFLLKQVFIFAESIGDVRNFYIDPEYDSNKRKEISALLNKISKQAYFYLDQTWWNDRDVEEREKIEKNLDSLSKEFDNHIYPRLTSIFGKEWRPGIDQDEHITILFHPLKKNAKGYFRSIDEYPKNEIIQSNEKEMIYLNADDLNTDIFNNSLIKAYLAHEFMHLISFNQKERKHNISEDIWLNEARADYAITILGYNDNYEGSILQQRVKTFIKNKNDSLTEWQGNSLADYGILNLFIIYLVEHYGLDILSNSLFLNSISIHSINQVLNRKNLNIDFSKIFTDFIIASFVNDCSLDLRYCFFNKNLKDFQILPNTTFLPFSDKLNIVTAHTTKDWAGNWYKFIGGEGKLKIKFISEEEFIVPYITETFDGKYNLDFFSFRYINNQKQGEIEINDYGNRILSVILFPFSKSKLSSFSNNEPSHLFSFNIFMEKRDEAKEKAKKEAEEKAKKESEEKQKIKKLKERIAFLKIKIKEVQEQLNRLLAKKQIEKENCQSFQYNLYFGLKNNTDVKCLQKFLKNRGEAIYPEGLITGNFWYLTKNALKRYQASKGLEQTGIFDTITRKTVKKDLGL